MNTNRKTIPSDEGKRLLETLRQAVDKALEKKRAPMRRETGLKKMQFL